MQQYATQQQMQQQMQAMQNMQNMGQYGTHGAHPQNQGQHPPPPHVHFKQYPNNYPEVVPTPNTTAAPQTISGNATYTQQQQIYIQQQQIYMAQQQQQYQTLRRKQQMQPQMAPQSIPTSQAIAPGSQAQMNQLVMQQQQVMASQLPPPPQHMINPQMSSQYIMSTASTQPPPPATIVTANNSIYVQSKTYGETTAMPNNKVYGETSALPSKTYGENTAIPTSVDSAMYERDKQIYKCSTLRHGGKYDPHMLHKGKGGVPATIPTVPQIPKFNNVAPPQANGVTTNGIRPSIQNCPLPEIPKVPISIPITKELPHNRLVWFFIKVWLI